MKRCIGHCCREFCLPESGLDDIKIRLACVEEKYLTMGNSIFGNVHYTLADYYYELKTVAEMLVPILDKPGKYTCNRYDWKTGNCSRYLERPKMCRGYPKYTSSGQQCQFADCQGESAKLRLMENNRE